MCVSVYVCVRVCVGKKRGTPNGQKERHANLHAAVLECIGGEEEIADELFLILVRVARPGATQYKQLNFVHWVTCVYQRACVRASW